MPFFNDSAMRRDSEVNLIILDPRCEMVCETYARFRRGAATRHIEVQWDTKRIYSELYATIYAAQRYNLSPGSFALRLFLRSESPMIRVDINDHWAEITSVDPRLPPILVPRTSSWYNTMVSNFNRMTEQLEEIRFLSSAQLPQEGAPTTPAGLIGLMEALGVPIPNRLSEGDRLAVAKAVLRGWRKGTTIYR